MLDVVFNHTAEGNEQGPYISYRGIDNKTYYLLTPDGYYYNFSGCGNTMNCNNAIVRNCILDALRYWVSDYHIDGFRFDLAAILSRDENGAPMTSPPLLETLAHDAVLGKCKLIAEAWDAGGLYQVGSFPAWGRWAEWNGKYRDSIRSFVKGDFWAAPDAVRRITGSMDMYGYGYAGYDSSINFITCHDGFSLYDMFAYNEKHNEANGWNNTDGANDNRSWNCGCEGETDNQEIMDLRFKMMRNAIAVLMCSRGTPMILQGDEFANTQFGNNNAYCQDNEISWLDWKLLEKNKAYFDFYRDMIQFRRKHPCIRKDLKPAVCGLPPITVFTDSPYNTNINDNTKVISVMFAGFIRKKGHDDIVIMSVNSYWEDIQITLPTPPEGAYWTLVVDTAAEDKRYFNNRPKPLSVPNWRMKARSVSVFIAAYGVEYGR
jgi:glycogen operon protein